MKQHTFKTELKNRTLFYDGDTVISPDRILEFIDSGISDFYVTEVTDEIREYNQYTSNRITTKQTNQPLKFDWNIPEPYKSIDVSDYVIGKWAQQDLMSDKEADLRSKRIADELQLYKKLQLYPVLRTIIYIINTLEEKNIVWGVGRGSSVSSYVLYLIGVHDVDSVKYDLKITDFLRTPA